MKKNVAKLLFLVSVLSVGNILNAYNENTNTNKKSPIEIRIDDGKKPDEQSGKQPREQQPEEIDSSIRGGTQKIKNSAGSITVDSSHTSKGQNDRPSPVVQQVVLHYTALNRELSLRALTNNDVSAHYLVSDWQADPVFYLVDEKKRAWHAGVSEWKGTKNLNNTSIGIEIVNDGDVSGRFEPFKDFQIKEVAVLLRYLVDKYNISATNVIGHSDIAPQRKPDPGPLFPWEELYKKYNIGMWYDNSRKTAYENQYASTWDMIPASTVQAEFSRFGYAISQTGIWDGQTKNVIKVFQYHFRPSRYDGKLDLETYAILKALNEKYNR